MENSIQKISKLEPEIRKAVLHYGLGLFFVGIAAGMILARVVL